MRLLVTGGAGFIGSNFIHYILETHPGDTILNLDTLTYAGNLENLSDIEDDPRYAFERGDIADAALVSALVAEARPDAIVNFAAESHVDRSIEDPAIFLRTNVEGTLVLLDAARIHQVSRFLQVSTDEVYGSLGDTGAFTEDSPLAPSSPYAASKAAADLLVRSYHRTYGLPAVITRSSNNYGPYQFPEKLIPLMVTNALEGKPLPVYGNGGNVRDWLHVRDNCAAIDRALRHGKDGEVYNIGGSAERTNLEVVRAICRALGRPERLITFVEDRPGHDWRYAMDSSRIDRELGWRPSRSFEAGLEETIRWYKEHRDWWEKVRRGEYRLYYERMYTRRIREGRRAPGQA